MSLVCMRFRNVQCAEQMHGSGDVFFRLNDTTSKNAEGESKNSELPYEVKSFVALNCLHSVATFFVYNFYLNSQYDLKHIVLKTSL